MTFYAFYAFYAFYPYKKHLRRGKSLVCVLCFLRFLCFLYFLCFLCFLCVWNLLVKKKIIIIIIKRFKSTVIPSFTILLTCTLDYQEFICTRLFLFVIIIFFIISCKNLFFVNLLQYFPTTSKHKLKILRVIITFTYSFFSVLILIFFLPFKIYFHLCAFILIRKNRKSS